MNKPLRKAAFIDRDGVINVDVGYLHQVEDLQLTDRAGPALLALAAAGFLIVVVTNQSGIGRGYYAEHDFQILTTRLNAILSAAGAQIAATYHCPHTPDAGCNCRKPKPGMILRAADELGIDLARSVMIGDKASDIAAGRAAGVGHCFLIGADEATGADANYGSLWECAIAISASNAPQAAAARSRR